MKENFYLKEKNELKLILDSLELSHRHLNLCRESFKSFRPSYHNELHCYSTAKTFYELAGETKMRKKSIRNGVVAAIYHDAQHLAKRNDALNIASSIDWIDKKVLLEESLDGEKIKDLIRATNNSNKIFRGKTEVLLHDADILLTVKGNFLENFIWQKRLAEETLLSITVENSLYFVSEELVTAEAKAFFTKKFLKNIKK